MMPEDGAEILVDDGMDDGMDSSSGQTFFADSSSTFFERTGESINAALLSFLEEALLPEISLEDSNAAMKGHPWFHPPKKENLVIESVDDFDSFQANPKQAFFRQAGLYADKEGLPREEVPFSAYYPDYAAMNPGQSAWYFYWRSNVRRKIFIQTDISYVFLYFYELIHRIGFSSSEEALDQILFVWKEARCGTSAFDPYLAVWVRDFILYYGLDLEYYAVVEGVMGAKAGKYLCQECILYFLDGEKKPGVLYALEECSDYPVTAGRFYTNGYDSLLEDAVCHVFRLWDRKYMEKEKKNLMEVLCGGVPARSVQKPFESALFYEHGQARQAGNPRVNSKITYSVLSRSIESTLIPGFREIKKWRRFITGMLRTVESLLRDYTGYRWSIQKGRLSKTQLAFIEKQCAIFYQEYTTDQKRKEKKIFYVNDDVLVNLKADSEEIRQILIREQEQDGILDGFFEEDADDLPSEVQETDDEQIKDGSPDDGFFVSVPAEDPFSMLFRQFTPVQAQVVAALCEYSSLEAPADNICMQTLRHIASVSNTFPDVIIEEINNLAMDLIGDCVIDSNGAVPSVYPDYLNEIKEAMSNGGS